MKRRYRSAGLATALWVVLSTLAACGFVQDREASSAAPPTSEDEATELDDVPDTTTPAPTTPVSIDPSALPVDPETEPGSPPAIPDDSVPPGGSFELLSRELDSLGPQCRDFARLRAVATLVFNNDANLPLPLLKEQMAGIILQAVEIVKRASSPPPEAERFESELGPIIDRIKSANSSGQVYSQIVPYLRQYGPVVDEVVAALVTTCRFPDEPTMIRPAAEVTRWLEERSGLVP